MNYDVKQKATYAQITTLDAIRMFNHAKSARRLIFFATTYYNSPNTSDMQDSLCNCCESVIVHSAQDNRSVTHIEMYPSEGVVTHEWCTEVSDYFSTANWRPACMFGFAERDKINVVIVN